MTCNCENQIKTALQEQSEEIQRSWLSPSEAEGLRRKLAAAEANWEALQGSIRERIEWLGQHAEVRFAELQGVLRTMVELSGDAVADKYREEDDGA